MWVVEKEGISICHGTGLWGDAGSDNSPPLSDATALETGLKASFGCLLFALSLSDRQDASLGN